METGTILIETKRKEPVVSKINFLPAKVKSLCPECLAVIDAELDEYAGRVFMNKKCSQHGLFRELISTDVRFYNLTRSRDMSRPRHVDYPIEAEQGTCAAIT